MLSVRERGIKLSVKGTGGGEGVSLDTRYLHQSAHRVAGHAKVVLKTHLGSIFYL